jgi:hypothetical protein
MSGYGWHCQKCGAAQDGYMLTKWARSALYAHKQTCEVVVKEPAARKVGPDA